MKRSLWYLALLLQLFLHSVVPILAQFILSEDQFPTAIQIPTKIPIEECVKKRNVIIYGIPADHQQTHQDLTEAVLKVLQRLKITLDVRDIKLIRRLGSTVSRSTAVLVTFASEEVKRYVFSHKSYLYGSGYKMELDVPKIISYRYRVLKPLYDRLIAKGANATIVWGKLYVNGMELPDCVAEKYLFSTTKTPKTTPNDE